jgi:outer membrane protein assembly factor BamD (BamD/ComL family)
VFGRFEAVWTPTVLVMSSKGHERWRMEGYAPRDEFRVWMEMGLGRTAFMGKRWDEALKWYSHITEEHPQSAWAPEALYWKGVCQYKATNDHTFLQPTAKELAERFPGTPWTVKASVWLG